MQKWFEYVKENPRTTVMGLIGLIGIVNHLLDNPHVWNNHDELADAIIKRDRPAIIDGLGDVLVTLIVVAALEDLDLTECLASAYAEIKDRKGTLMPNGVFVKEVAK